MAVTDIPTSERVDYTPGGYRWNFMPHIVFKQFEATQTWFDAAETVADWTGEAVDRATRLHSLVAVLYTDLARPSTGEWIPAAVETGFEAIIANATAAAEESLPDPDVLCPILAMLGDYVEVRCRWAEFGLLSIPIITGGETPLTVLS